MKIAPLTYTENNLKRTIKIPSQNSNKNVKNEESRNCNS